MISYLKIQNIGLLEDVELTFGKGMTAITGETGSGKSMLLQAVKLMMGEKNVDHLRCEEKKAQIKIIFDVFGNSIHSFDLPTNFEVTISDPQSTLLEPNHYELHLSKIFEKTEKSIRGRSFINDEPVTHQLLHRVCKQLIEIIGQNEHQILLKPEQQFLLFDRTIKTKLKEQLFEQVQSFKKALEQKKEIELRQKLLSEKEEFLRFQLNELENAQLQANEDNSLKERLKALKSSDKIRNQLQTARLILMDNEGSIIEQMGKLLKIIPEFSTFDETLNKTVLRLEEIKISLLDILANLEKAYRQFKINPNEIQALEDRLHQVLSFVKKHGVSVDNVLAKKEQIKNEINQLESIDKEMQSLDLVINQYREKILPLATMLSQKRSAAAKLISKNVQACIQQLGLKKALIELKLFPNLITCDEKEEFSFTLESGQTVKISHTGYDTAEWFFCPNPGELEKPLKDIASGGELSRISLAIKYVLKESFPDLTYIFDEVDSGIGGDTATEVGRYLQLISQQNQLLCVTHLPQVAAFADHHIGVSKLTKDGRTKTFVQQLSNEERITEIARMLGGGQASASAQVHAKTLLDQYPKNL